MAQRAPTQEQPGPPPPLTQEERKEIFHLLGELSAAIHRLSTTQVRTVMGVDDHIRKNELSGRDLDALRAVQQQYQAASGKK